MKCKHCIGGAPIVTYQGNPYVYHLIRDKRRKSHVVLCAYSAAHNAAFAEREMYRFRGEK